MVKIVTFIPPFEEGAVISNHVNDALVEPVPVANRISVVLPNFLLEVFLEETTLLKALTQVKVEQFCT
jgi:hypothetical protein